MNRWHAVSIVIGILVGSLAILIFVPMASYWEESPEFPAEQVEYPILWANVQQVFLDTPVAIMAKGLVDHNNYSAMYSNTHKWITAWTSSSNGSSYLFVVLFERKHMIGDYVGVYLFSHQTQCVIDSLFFEVVEVDGL